jgi:hypothetical protein
MVAARLTEADDAPSVDNRPKGSARAAQSSTSSTTRSTRLLYVAARAL